MSVFIILLVVVVVIFAVKDIRLNLISRPTFKMFKKVLPPQLSFLWQFLTLWLN
jgi:acyl-CoA dehydrogenase